MNILKKHTSSLLCFFFAFSFLFLFSKISYAAVPKVRVLDSRQITNHILETRTQRQEILVERQISRIQSLKDGGVGTIINAKKKSPTAYYGQISGLRKGYYVTTYYFYNPYSDDLDDAIMWYSFVTRSPHGAKFKVVTPSRTLQKRLCRRRIDHTIYIKKDMTHKPNRSVTFSLYNPENNHPRDIVDSWTFTY